MASEQTDTTGAHPMRVAAQNVANAGEEMARQAGQIAERRLQNPGTAAAVVGVIALGAAATFGVLQTVVGGGAAYLAYRVFRKRKEEQQAGGEEQGKEEQLGTEAQPGMQPKPM